MFSYIVNTLSELNTCSMNTAQQCLTFKTDKLTTQGIKSYEIIATIALVKYVNILIHIFIKD